MNEVQAGLIQEAGATTSGMIPLRALRDPMVRSMLDYWQSKCGQDGRRLPRPADMDPVDFRQHLPSIAILQVDYDPIELTYRLVGEEVNACIGVACRGRTVRSLDAEHKAYGSMLHELYTWIALNARPVALRGDLNFLGRKYRGFEAVNLPLSDSGERTERLMVVTAFNVSIPDLPAEPAIRPKPVLFNL